MSEITLDEHQVLDAAMFASTVSSIALQTAMTESKARRLVQGLVKRGLLDEVEMREGGNSGRKQRCYRRVGPQD